MAALPLSAAVTPVEMCSRTTPPLGDRLFRPPLGRETGDFNPLLWIVVGYGFLSRLVLTKCVLEPFPLWEIGSFVPIWAERPATSIPFFGLLLGMGSHPGCV